MLIVNSYRVFQYINSQGTQPTYEQFRIHLHNTDVQAALSLEHEAAGQAFTWRRNTGSVSRNNIRCAFHNNKLTLQNEAAL